MDKFGSRRSKAIRPPATSPRRGAGTLPLLRGNAIATVDDSGRLKLPAGFRRTIEEGWGPHLFLSSLHGDCLWIYPLAIWQEKEQRMLGLSSQHPAVSRFLSRVSYFGSQVELDSQGRVVVPPVLRAQARIEGEVAVLGSLHHLEVWNNTLFRARLEAEPITRDDQRALAEIGL